MSTILGPDGKPAIEAAEGERPIERDLSYFTAIAKEYAPDATPQRQTDLAKHMHGRHPIVQRAFAAGLRNGRDIRERLEHGLGIWYEELAPLTPRERGFVLDRVKEAVMPKMTA